MFVLDTNVISGLRKAAAGKADRNLVAWARCLPDGSLFMSVIAPSRNWKSGRCWRNAATHVRELCSGRVANAARNDLMRLNLDLFPFEPFADRIWELRHNVTSHDAWYVALAESLKLPRATLDERLLKASGVTCDGASWMTRPGSGGCATQ